MRWPVSTIRYGGLVCLTLLIGLLIDRAMRVRQLEADIEIAKSRLLELNRQSKYYVISHRIGFWKNHLEIDLSGNDGLRDISPLRGLPVTHLYLRYSGIDRLDALQGMPLEVVDITATNVTDLHGIAGAPIRYLVLENTPVSDLGLLKGMPLEHLDISKTRVRTLLPLRGMSLKYLAADETDIVDIGVLKEMSLEELRLTETSISDIGALAGMPLKRLDLCRTNVHEIGALRGMSLQSLSICSTGVRDLRVLSGMKLESLNLRRTDVRSIEALRGMSLRNLMLPDRVEHTEVLTSLKHLVTLGIPKHWSVANVKALLPRLHCIYTDHDTRYFKEGWRDVCCLVVDVLTIPFAVLFAWWTTSSWLRRRDIMHSYTLVLLMIFVCYGNLIWYYYWRQFLQTDMFIDCTGVISSNIRYILSLSKTFSVTFAWFPAVIWTTIFSIAWRSRRKISKYHTLAYILGVSYVPFLLLVSFQFIDCSNRSWDVVRRPY